MPLSLLLLTLALALRGATANRYVRGRLLVSAALFAVHLGLVLLRAYAPLSAAVVALLAPIQPLVLVLGVLNALVALVINPWRTDRVPDRFPKIVQDTILIALFGVAATLVLQEKILATTAVGAVVIGFALQDTLGNLFAGLAIQIEKPFRVGHWINVAGKEGRVSEITWRATKLRTGSGNFVVVPNSTLSRETITNYSEPTHETRVEVEVGVSYEAPPNQVKAAILDAVRDEPLVAPDHDVDVLIVDFAASSITYRIRVWLSDFDNDLRLRDRIRSRTYYALRRAGFEIPYPTQVQIARDAAIPIHDSNTDESTLRAVTILAPLSDAQRTELASRARRLEYGGGESIVREGEPGSSMFVVASGQAVVTLDGGRREVARHGPGGFFGEMSLLTGEPRTATVAAVSDCSVLEITVDDFRRLVMTDPAVVESVATAVATRRIELERHRAEGAASAAAEEAPQNFVARVRRFLHLSL